MQDNTPKIGIIMGSSSDLEVMQPAADLLKSMGVSYEMDIVSAHRTPHRMMQYAEEAEGRGLQIIIAGAGGAAHLPGMVASVTNLPVIGVPIKSSNSLEGWDSILSILQMPNGVPVATVALNGAQNAALLAVKILSLYNESLKGFLNEFYTEQKQKVLDSVKKINNN